MSRLLVLYRIILIIQYLNSILKTMGSFWSKKEEQESSEVRAERKRQKGQAVSKPLFSCNPYVLKRVR